MTRATAAAVEQAFDWKRRTPKQGRALFTVETIFEATAQILERDGAASFSTNRLAERAGISVGTLYQYFPNKQAILRALAGRECRRLSAEASASLADPALPMAERRRRAVRAFLNAFEGRRELQRAILRDVLPGDEELTRALDEFVNGVLNGTGCGRSFIQGHAIIGAIRAAVLARSPHLETREFEEELFRLVADDAPA